MRCATITVPMSHDALAFASEERVEVLYSTVPRCLVTVYRTYGSKHTNRCLLTSVCSVHGKE